MRKPSSKSWATPARSSRFMPKPSSWDRRVVAVAEAEVDGDVVPRQRQAPVDPGRRGRGADVRHEGRREQRHERGGSPRVQSGAWPGYTSAVSDLIQLRRSPREFRSAGSRARVNGAAHAEGLSRDLRLPDERRRQRPDAGAARSRRLRAHRRSGGGRSDPDQHLRRAREGRGARVRARAACSGTARRGPTSCSAITGCMAEHLKDEIRRPRARRRRGDRPRRLPAPARQRRGGARAAARSRTRALDREETYEGLDPIARRRRRDRPRHDPARLRQVLHVLRRPLHARARARRGAARDPAPGARAGRGRRQGGAAARPDRELVPLGGRRLRGAAARGGRRRRHRARALHVALPARFRRRRHRGDRRDAARSASTSTCRCRADPTRCWSACAAATTSRRSARSYAKLRARCPASRSRPTC